MQVVSCLLRWTGPGRDLDVPRLAARASWSRGAFLQGSCNSVHDLAGVLIISGGEDAGIPGLDLYHVRAESPTLTPVFSNSM